MNIQRWIKPLLIALLLCCMAPLLQSLSAADAGPAAKPVPPEDQQGLLAASQFMDANECETLIPTARTTSVENTESLLSSVNAAGNNFSKQAQNQLGRQAEF